MPWCGRPARRRCRAWARCRPPSTAPTTPAASCCGPACTASRSSWATAQTRSGVHFFVWRVRAVVDAPLFDAKPLPHPPPPFSCLHSPSRWRARGAPSSSGRRASRRLSSPLLALAPRWRASPSAACSRRLPTPPRSTRARARTRRGARRPRPAPCPCL